MKKLTLLTLISASLAAISLTTYNTCVNRSVGRPSVDDTKKAKTMQSFFELKSRSLAGDTVAMSQFAGKKVVVLNVASKCGYTPQYADWQKFYEENKESVVVLGFPSNDFGRQEPGTAEEITEFCERNYGVTFPMFEKAVVKGEGKHPVYVWLSDPKLNGWNKEEPTWNFCKYLINEKGELTHFFGSNVKPSSQEFFNALSQ